MPVQREKHILVSITGALFYIAIMIQWLWSSLPYLPGIVQFAGTLQTTPQNTQPIQHVPATGPPSVILIAIVIGVTIFIIAATVYLLLKLPATVGSVGEKMTKSATEYIVPVISHHVKLTPKKRQWLTARIMLDVKIALSIIPIVIAALCFLVGPGLPYDIVMLIAASLGIFSFTLLLIQIGLTKWLKVSPKSF
ncbi:MAG: hypothetical protein ABIQ04_04775 [Candidatus Saccharimonadales bacterium]